ncbi:MAG: hypothetical protein ACOX1Q_06480 [Eubacteriales bacterium]|jgi:hypothetical protein
MVRNRRIASLSVLSLLATIMTALALTVNNPIADGNFDYNDINTGLFSENHDVLENTPAMEVATGIEGKQTDTEKEYLLKDTSGFIGIYSLDDPNTPQVITEIVISKLREADAEMLKEGIVVKGDEELAKLLEDFGS